VRGRGVEEGVGAEGGRRAGGRLGAGGRWGREKCCGRKGWLEGSKESLCRRLEGGRGGGMGTGWG